MMVVMGVISEIEFKELGMSLTVPPPKWRNCQEKKNVKVFITYYGACPWVCASIWLNLQTAVDPGLWPLCWYKRFSLASPFGIMIPQSVPQG
jgi:hypothetical protein